ncbi:MAG: phosphohistidine phosphatase SixA [Gemmataceae bacterium]
MLRLYLIRHAEAVSADDPNYKDEERPLVDAGRIAARKLGQELAARGVRFDAILTSPLVRARQTTDELVAGLGASTGEVHIIDELEPGKKMRKLDRELLKYEGESIALVGHQPDLGDYAARLIGSKKRSIKLDKPGVACVACDDPPGKECGELVWLLTPEWFGAAEPAVPQPEPVLYAAQGG